MTIDQRKVQLGVEVDASGARSGFGQVEAAAKDMAKSVAQSGQQAGKGVDSIGSGSDAAAKKLDSATKSIIGSVERATAAMKAGERGSASYFETLANQRGVSASALKPYLDELRQAEAAQNAAVGSLNTMGMSAKATAAALRGVPAQFTDIAVSLQGGQQPLTVLLQQGGQLKDMFGGAGNAAKALGGYVLGLINPFSIAVAAVGALGFAYYKGSQESDAYNRALILSGNAAGVTSGKLGDMAAHLATLGTSQGKASEALAAFAATGQFGANSLERFSSAAINYSKVTGTAIDDTVKQFAELGKSPLDASVRLNDSMNYLTQSLYDQIKALDAQGRHTEAANLAQNAFADTIDSRAAEMANKLGLVERAWLGIKKAVLGAVDATLNVGRDLGPDALIKQQTLRVVNAQNNVDYEQRSGYGGSRGLAESQAVLATERERLDVLQKQSALAALRAIDRKDEANAVKAQIEFDKETDKYKTNAVKLQQELVRLAQQYASVTHDGERGAKNAEAYATAIAKVKDQYKEPKAAREQAPDLGTYDALIKSIKESIAVQELDLATTEKLTAGQKTAAQVMANLRDGTLGLVAIRGKSVESQKQEIALGLERQIALEQQNAAQKELAKSQAEFVRSREAEQKRQVGEIASLGDKAQAIEDEIAAYGLSKEAIDALAVSRLQEQKAILLGFDNSKAQIELIDQEIEARQRLAKAQDGLAAKNAGAKAAKTTVEEWMRAAEKIENSITDALMRGFENGKGFAENLRDTVVNMFKTMVLRPVISAIVSPIAGSIAALTGTPAQAVAAAGGFGNGGVLNTASNINSIYGTAAQAYAGATAGASLASLGYANTVAAVGGDGLGALIAANGQWAGVAAGATEAGAAAGSAAGASAGASGITSALAAVPGWGWAALAVLAIAGAGDFSGGREYTTGAGIKGKFGGAGFNGQNYQMWKNDGSNGFFGIGASGSSSGTNYSALNATTGKGLSNSFLGIQAQTAAFAKTLGLSADAIQGFSKDITLAFGEDAEANKKAIATLLTGIADDLAKTVLDSQYIREGEAAASTLARLAVNLSAVNSAFSVLDKTALTVGQAGGDAASQLVDMLGGLDKFTRSTLGYYQQFYTEAERNAKTTEQLAASFAGLGVAVPDSVQAYRDLVNAQDINTDAGRRMYTTLIGLSGAFATVTNAAADASAKAAAAAEAEAANIAKTLIKAIRYATYADYATASYGAGLTPTPRFAAGGLHVGGLRLVGERGPELEATGPARIWNAEQLAGALDRGAGDTSAAEVRALREDNRAQALALAALNSRMVKLFERWDSNGMPEVRTV